MGAGRAGRQAPVCSAQRGPWCAAAGTFSTAMPTACTCKVSPAQPTARRSASPGPGSRVEPLLELGLGLVQRVAVLREDNDPRFRRPLPPPAATHPPPPARARSARPVRRNGGPAPRPARCGAASAAPWPGPHRRALMYCLASSMGTRRSLAPSMKNSGTLTWRQSGGQGAARGQAVAQVSSGIRVYTLRLPAARLAGPGEVATVHF